jgi:hypothetical protein
MNLLCCSLCAETHRDRAGCRGGARSPIAALNAAPVAELAKRRQIGQFPVKKQRKGSTVMWFHLFNEFLPFCHTVHPVAEHCLKFNPVVKAYDKAHHFMTCLG